VRCRWARDGVYDLLDDLYDQILVYGQQDVYDVASEYGLSPTATSKTRYMGYLRRQPRSRSAAQIRVDLRLQTGRLVLVTAGGGGDGYDLLRTALEAARLSPQSEQCDWLLVSGPLMPVEHRRGLLDLARANSRVRFFEYVEDLTDYVAAADAIVSMAGYNSICEILSFGRPAVVVPRVTPSKEQLIRAKALSSRGLVRMVHPADLTPGRILDEVNQLLDRPIQSDAPLNLEGLSNVAAELEALLAQGAPLGCQAQSASTPGYGVA
jgi:predicted glycosyltransferase